MITCAVKVVNGVVVHVDAPGPKDGYFAWTGTPPALNSADPRPEHLQNDNYDSMIRGLLLVNSKDPIPYSVQKWLELYGDWLNELNRQIFGKYRSKEELINEWVSRMNNTYIHK